MVQSSYARLPNKILLGFDFQELTIKELIVEASIEYYDYDPVDVLLDLLLTSIEQEESIQEVLATELEDNTRQEKELKQFLANLHLRLVATLRSVGCYSKDGKLLYRFLKPIERGFLLERL